MILLTICIYVLYLFLSFFGIVAVLIFAISAYLINRIIKYKKKDNIKAEKEIEKHKKYKIVDLSDNKKVLYSYDYQVDARKKLRELREQKRNVMISLK